MSKYALLPYRRPSEVANFFNEFDRNFFAPFQSFASAFSTDIIDEGDHYLLEAEPVSYTHLTLPTTTRV